MKKLVVFMVMLPICFYIKAQKNNQLDSLINASLVTYMVRNYESNLLKNSSEDIHILIDNYPRNFVFCQKIQDMKLKYISLMNLSSQKGIQKEKRIKTIFLDINLEGNQLTITFSDRVVTIQKNNDLKIELSDWGNFIHKYSCEKQEWFLSKIEYRGI